MIFLFIYISFNINFYVKNIQMTNSNSIFFIYSAILTKRSCANQKQIEIKAEGGLLASLITRQTECGSPKSPYIIRAGNGQRLNFTLHDYSYIGDIDDDGQLPSNQGSRSVSYANLRDGDDIHSHRKTVYGTNRRTTHGFLSETHVVQVILFGGMAGRYFALEYQGNHGLVIRIYKSQYQGLTSL